MALGLCGEVAPSRMMSRFLACQVAINNLKCYWKLVEAVSFEILANMMTSARCTSSIFRQMGCGGVGNAVDKTNAENSASALTDQSPWASCTVVYCI
jgi:hypothetical protein